MGKIIKSKFHVDVYDCDVIVHISDNIRDSINYYAEKAGDEKMPEGEDYYGFFYRPQTEIHTYIVFYDIKYIDQDRVNHEKSHLVEQILLDRDIEPLGDTRAYLDAFISKKINIALKKRGFVIKD